MKQIDLIQRKWMRVFGVYFLTISALAVFVMATSLDKEVQVAMESEENFQIALATYMINNPVEETTISILHSDLTGLEKITHKYRKIRKDRQIRKQARQQYASRQGQNSSQSSDPHYHHSSYSNKFVAASKNIQVVPVKYAEGLDSAGRSKIRTTIVDVASKHLGTRYVWAGSRPGGFDCSGFTSYVMAQHGIQLSRSSRYQARQGKKKALKDAQVGDLVFFSRYGKGGRVTHVALVVDNTPEGVHVMHATSRGIVVDNINTSKYWKPKILYAKDVISG
ncbi:MAG: C40 family peptidase [Saprospiraceae bacterium]|nr:C40 family peptidase [Saprospiraceae bacterium]